MNMKNIKQRIFLAWIVAMLCLSSVVTVKAAGNSVISLLPESISVTVGDSFYIYLNASIDSDEKIGGWQVVSLNFTPTILQALGVTEGTAFSGYSSAFSAGTINNTAGRITNTYAFIMGADNVSGNLYFARYSMNASDVGMTEVNFSTKISYGETSYTHGRNFTNVTVHPEPVTGSVATTYGSDQINLTWTTPFGAGVDDCVIFANTTGFPTDRKPGDEIYNGSLNHFEHTGLSPSTRYNYTIWGYNTRTGIYSLLFQQVYNTTDSGPANATLTVSTPSPTNGTTLNYRVSQTVSALVTKTGGSHSNLQYWINDTTGNIKTGTIASGSTISTTMSVSTGSNWWSVYLYSEGNSTFANYTFAINTPSGGGGGGGDWDPTPTNGAPNISINTALSVNVDDPDLDTVNVTFYWGDGTRIDNDTVVASGIASVSPSTLSYDTEYFWYVIADDGLDTTRGPITGNWSFNTSDLGLSITKEWEVITSNNSLKAWINVSNTGSTNLTNVYVYDILSAGVSYSNCNPSYESKNGQQIIWKLIHLNISTTTSITLWCNLNSSLTNGTTISNAVNISHLGVTVNDTAQTYQTGISVSSEANRTLINETRLSIKWWINVSNTGDFTLTNITITETYPSCINFSDSNIATADNITFVLSDILPGDTFSFYVNLTGTPGCLSNGTRVYHNASISTNQTGTSTVSDYVLFGGRTERIRIIYDSQMTDVSNYGDTVMNILGVLLIIAAIFLVVGMVYKFRGGGGQ